MMTVRVGANVEAVEPPPQPARSAPAARVAVKMRVNFMGRISSRFRVWVSKM